jgi:uncharacterized membrane-anchored protein YitT (DUF2179 family)
MRPVALFLVFLTLTVVVVGISVAILRTLHNPILAYALLIPIWVGVLLTLIMVARATFRGTPRGNGQ